MDQILGAAIRTSHCIPNSQCCRSAGKNGSNLVRDASTGCSGHGKSGWVRLEGGLGHVRYIHLISLHLTTFLTTNYFIVPHSENRILGGSKWRRGIHRVPACHRTNGVMQSSATLVFCEDRIVQLIKWSELFLVNEIELAETSQLRLLTGSFSLRTSCTNRKKCR